MAPEQKEKPVPGFQKKDYAACPYQKHRHLSQMHKGFTGLRVYKL
jgi:hypothetical protein